MAGKQAKKRAKARRKRGGTTPMLFDIRLKSLPDALDTYEKVVKAFAEGKIKKPKYCGLIYGFNGYTSLLRLHEEAQIKEKMEKLEKLIMGVTRK